MSFAKCMNQLRMLSTEALQRETLLCRSREQGETVVLIAHLAEVQRRELFSDLGYSSLFAYCEGELGLTDAEAYLRMQVARAALRHPGILDRLKSRTLSLTVAATIAPVLTADNAHSVLDRAGGMTKVQAKELLADLRPRPTVQSGVRRRPRGGRRRAEAGLFEESTNAATIAEVDDGESSRDHEDRGLSPAEMSDPGSESPGSTPKGRVEPADRDVYNVRFCADRDLKDNIERLGEVLGIRDPFAALDQIVSKAVDALLDQKDPQRREARRRDRAARKVAAEEKAESNESTAGESTPGESTPLNNSNPVRPRRRAIPAAVRDSVLGRAEQRCEFRSGGRRCRERSGLQVDHIVPHGMGGSDHESNLRILCGPHNRWKAKKDYGRAFVEKKIAESQAKRGVSEGSASWVTECGPGYSALPTIKSKTRAVRTWRPASSKLDPNPLGSDSLPACFQAVPLRNVLGPDPELAR